MNSNQPVPCVCGPTVVSVLDLNPRKLGSMEEYTVFLSRALRERGWRSVVILSQPVGEVVRPHFAGTEAVTEALVSGSKMGRQADLIRLLRKYRPEVIHFHFFEYFSFLPVLAWLARPKLLIFTDHCRQAQPISTLTKAECVVWDRVLFRLQGTRILAVSDYVKRTLVDCYRMSADRVEVVHNGVNVERFVPLEAEEVCRLRQERQIPTGQSVVVSVAALIPEKGVSDLLAAAKHVLAKNPNTLFIIVGDGPLSSSLKQEARELGIQGRVIFAGLRSDVNHWMAIADVVTVPSVWQEPAGLVVIEAMAVARPVVATRVGGIPEYLDDGVTGILVEPRAPEQLARALLRLLGSQAEAASMGRAGRMRVEKYFSMKRWILDTLEQYKKGLSCCKTPDSSFSSGQSFDVNNKVTLDNCRASPPV